MLKRFFGFTKVRYRGLKKDREWLCAAFAASKTSGKLGRSVPILPVGGERPPAQAYSVAILSGSTMKL